MATARTHAWPRRLRRILRTPSSYAFLGHLALGLLVTFPMLLHPSDLVGNGDVDVWNHAWGAWWWATELGQGSLPWQTEYLLWPEGGVLWFIDPVLAILGAPFVGTLGVGGTWNLVILGYVVFASWAARRFARALGAGPWASWAASAVFAASAWMTCEIQNGISEAVDIGFVALALAWIEDAARTKSLKSWAKAGVGVGLSAIASPYLGLGAGIAALVRGLPSIKHAWLGGIVAVLVAAPPSLALRTQLESPDAIIKHPDEMNDQLAAHNAVDPRTFIQPFGFRSVDLSHEGFQHSMYLGLVALLLVFFAFRASRQGDHKVERIYESETWWVLAALACAVFALGPYLFFNGGWLELHDGRRLRLPWGIIQQLMPGLAVTHPLRLAVPTLAVVAGLAALGLHHIARGPWALVGVGAILFDGLVLSGTTWPVPIADLTYPAVYSHMVRQADEPLRWGVLDLPTDAGSTMGTSRYLVWQAAHGRPIPYAPDARASTCSLIHEPSYRVFANLSNRRQDEHKRLGLEHTENQIPHALALKERGIRWIVVHRDIDAEAAERIITTLTSDLGAGTAVGTAMFWDLGASDKPPKKNTGATDSGVITPVNPVRGAPIDGNVRLPDQL